MWAKIDDALTEHAKVFIAGARLGRRQTGRILAIWLEARCWANRQATQGFLPEAAVAAFKHDREPLRVAEALSAPITDEERATWNISSAHCLWTKVPGGYRIHDDEHYSPRAPTEELRRVRSELGRQGGLRSAQRRSSKPPSPVLPGEAKEAKDEANLLQVCLENEANGEAKREAISFEIEAKSKQNAKQNAKPRVPGTSVLPKYALTPDVHLTVDVRSRAARAKSSPLVAAPLNPRNYAYPNDVVGVPGFAHERYLSRLVNAGVTRPEAERRLVSWYDQVCGQWRGRTIGDREGAFWDKRFEEWQGRTPTTSAPSATTTVGDTNAAYVARRRGTS